MFHRPSWCRALSSIAICVAGALAACATNAGRDAFRRSETQLEAARKHALIECATPDECARAWSRARAFVQAHSPTGIVSTTNDTIETRMPHEFGVAYFWAVRVAADNGASVIRLKGMCRGMYSSDGGPGWAYRDCAAQLRDAQLEFARVVRAARQ